jgi:hypothetical protein
MIEESISAERIQSIIFTFVEDLRSDLADRITAWACSDKEQQAYEVILGLMSRQITLACQLAQAPQCWNGHSAPLFYRAMADVHINLAYILEDKVQRAEKFVLYGLGQMKLNIEHRKNKLPDGPDRQLQEEIVVAMTQWLDSQRFSHLIEVNISPSWSGTNTWGMAKELGLDDFYSMVYQPFSACTHSSWSHIFNYNLQPCSNPLHKPHREPVEIDLGIHPEYLRLAGKYANKTLVHFDSKVALGLPHPRSYKHLLAALAEENYDHSIDATADCGDLS